MGGVEDPFDVGGRATGDIGERLPVTGVGFSKYWPVAGGTYSPPM
jgi:hypothetical protein